MIDTPQKKFWVDLGMSLATILVVVIDHKVAFGMFTLSILITLIIRWQESEKDAEQKLNFTLIAASFLMLAGLTSIFIVVIEIANVILLVYTREPETRHL